MNVVWSGDMATIAFNVGVLMDLIDISFCLLIRVIPALRL